jgi:hypothetical protein
MGLGMVHLGRVKRPKHVKPPKYLSPSPPVPKPEPVTKSDPPAGEEGKPDPTRYGDWERKGIAIDF